MNRDTIKNSDKSDLFPDLQLDTPPHAPDTRSSDKSSSKSIDSTTPRDCGNNNNKCTNPTAKQILLKYQCMPHYPTTEESRQQLESFMERCENRLANDSLLQSGDDEGSSDGTASKGKIVEGNEKSNALNQRTAKYNTIQENIIILHSLFSKFCSPPPSIESICSIVLLETRRVRALRGARCESKVDISNDETADLPKEPLVHTSSVSSQFVISILRAPPKGCLFKLPLEFQLSFFRILTRLLSEEEDQAYDDECLFDWSFMNGVEVNVNNSAEKDASEVGLTSRERGDVKKNLSSDTDDDSSYHVIQRGSSFSFNNQTKSTNPKVTSSQKSLAFNRSSSSINHNADIATQTWSYANWKKKKSSPLYSTIRFCSNLAWRSNSSSTSKLLGIPQRQRWDFVADNVKLDDEEEEELRSESVFEDGCGGGVANGLVGTFIDMYLALLDECLKAEFVPNSMGQYLLLGPLAHLLGLIISAIGASVKNLRKLLVIAEGWESSINSTQQTSRRHLQTISSTKQSLRNASLYLARLHIIRMLRYAAEYSTQSNGILDKVGPQSFFSFGDGGQGLSTTLFDKPWPFKHDFGMACWFRAETFLRASSRNGSRDHSQDTVLFRTRTQDGAQIEISFEACSSDAGNVESMSSTAATLVVTVTDAHEPNDHKVARKVRLVGCVLSPLVWYHVAVRLTKSKPSPFSLNFSNKNELSIFLNGKLMLREQMKLPRFPESSSGGLSGGLASVALGSFGRSIASGNKTNPLELSFFCNFDGQAGALYVFSERVSEETIQALYRETAGPSDNGVWFTFSDGWDVSRSKLGHIAKALSSASMLSELEDVVLPNYPVLIGARSRKRKLLIDVVEEDMASFVPAELSRSAFGAKLLLVWHPNRVNNSIVVDLHSGVHVTMTEEISSCSFENIKDTLFSLGGPKRLIPILAVLKAIPTSNHSSKDGDMALKAKGIDADFPNLFIPSLIFLIASFVRDHGVNARELYRCGAIHVIEKILYDCKKRELESSPGAYYGMGASLAVAKTNISAILDLWHSSRQVFGLEVSVFSQLLFNVTLLLGGVSNCDGLHLHAVLLPVLSEITRQNPDKVRDCVGTKPFFDFIKEYSTTEVEAFANNDPSTGMTPFHRFSQSNSPAHLTILERRIAMDFMFGIIVTMLARSCLVHDLLPLVSFLTHNLDEMWQEDNQNTKDASGETSPETKTKLDRSLNGLATLNAVYILFFLLQKSPPVPHLIESLTSILENGDGVASWMLCCMVNSFDDSIRGLGIMCLVAYMHAVVAFSGGGARDISLSQQDGSTAKLSTTVKYGLGVISHSSNVLASLLSGRDNVKVIYKLLWHLLKCHRERLGEKSNAGLMYLLVDDSTSSAKSSLSLADIVVASRTLPGGFVFDVESLDDCHPMLNIAATLSRQHIRNFYSVSTVLRLLRFLSNDLKEKWLFDFLALMLASPNSVAVVLSCDDWQPCLFQLVAEVVEEINGGDNGENDGIDVSQGPEIHHGSRKYKNEIARKFDTQSLSKPSVRTRYDLSLKLYSSLLGHCIRKGDDKSFEAVETAASLQRVDVNGPEIFGIVLSHLLADLIAKGTIESVEDTYQNETSSIKNRALKQSARLVTQAILTNGCGLDMTAAVRQWRSLRHLTALAVAVVTDFGFGITELFDYQNQDAAAVDGITGGVYGIRLGDNLVSGINAFEALASAQLHANTSNGRTRSQRDRHRYASVVLSSQVLTLLDAFIFPDNLDSSTAASQLHGLALVRSTEPRLGQSQGPLLASLIRLSLILLAYLEPCSVRFLQACSRLRCFLHWALEIIRESVALGGYSIAFHELTAPFDRLVLAIVLHCHRALSRCSCVLVEIESSPWDKYFSDVDSRQKSHRRLFRAILELREIVLAAYRGRNEVLRASLSLQAHDALSRGLEGGELLSPRGSDPPKSVTSREESLRSFLGNEWVTGFHDVEVVGNNVIPEEVGSSMGREAILLLSSESLAIVKDYKAVLNSPWTAFCEHQRRWAETDAVREMEYGGDLAVKKLSSKQRSDAVEANRLMMAGFSLASQRFNYMLHLAHDPWTPAQWRISSYTDLLFRKILFVRNYNYNDHGNASYELTLGKERERLQEEEKLRREEEIKEALLQAGEAIIPYKETNLDDVEDDDPEETFVGWGADDKNDGHEQLVENDSDIEPAPVDDKLLVTEVKENKSDMDWDQLDFDETEDDTDSYSWAKKFVWSEGETFIRTFESVLIVTLQTNTTGILLLTSQNLYFHQTGEVIDVMTREKVETDCSADQDRKWKLSRLTDVHGRRYMLKAQALELFFADMRGLFVAFNGTKERDLFFSKLRTSCKAPLLRPLKSLNPRTIFKKSKITELWKKRKLSNFQYLMALNLMAGRTFNDITQYPVFPWILADYSSEELDLSDHKIYRDLSKPVGALNPDRLAQLIERFNELDGFPEEEKFLYGSHYSSPGVVLHYMVRQEPFTSMHIALQSGRFDCPDRLFFDIGGCWRSCLSSTSDVKELIPEFFTCPELFLNTNAFPLGETQSKTPVDNVILPPWAKGSPYEFIRIHRLALESDYVSNNLHHWIDLIFGYKQRGPAAATAHNIFHYLSYEGAVDIDRITDDVQRKAVEGHIQNFGQTPSQIMKEPHPTRSHPDQDFDGLFSEVLGYERLQCHTPGKQFGDGRYNETDRAIISLQLQGEYILAVHSDLTICSYKLSPSRGSIPFQLKNDKARKLESTSSSVALPGLHSHDQSIPGVDVSSQLESGSMRIGESSFALAKGGSDKADEPGSSITDASFFLMSIGYYDNSVRVHSMDSLQLKNTINGVHRGQITCIQVSSDGTVVVTGGEDGTCIVWVVDYNDFVTAIADGFVQPGDEKSGEDFLKCCHVLLGHTTPITCLCISTKLDVVVSGSRDGTICLHHIRSGRFIRSLHINAVSQRVENLCAGNAIPVIKLAIHSDGTFVAHLCDGSLHLITVNGHKLCSTSAGEMLNSMIICPQSETLITGGEKGLTRMWKLQDLSLKCTVDVSKYGQITSMLLIPSDNSPVAQFLCLGSENGLMSIVFRSPEVK